VAPERLFDVGFGDLFVIRIGDRSHGQRPGAAGAAGAGEHARF
jgi:hypothetical protein